MSARSRSDGFDAPEHPFRHQYLRRNFVGAKKVKAVILDDPAHARQQMIVAAAIRSHNSRQQHQRLEIGPQLPERRPHQ